MANDLVTPADLAHLPGAPFTDAQVDQAAASLRAAVGWHIAPVKIETVTLDVAYGEPVLRLPSRLVVTVNEVRKVDTDTVIAADRYRVSTGLARVRHKSSYWPSGYGAVTVNLTHGYEKCPPELFPALASLATSSSATGPVTQQSAGPFSVSYKSGLTDEQVTVVSEFVAASKVAWLADA